MTSTLTVSIQVIDTGLELVISVRRGLCTSMQKIWLCTELDCYCDERAIVISSPRMKGVIVDSNSEGE